MVYFFYRVYCMRVFEDTVAERERIQRMIDRYGYSPEHNLYWYEYCRDTTDANIFFESEFGDGGLLSMKTKDGKDYYIFCGPLALTERRTEVLLEYLENVFSKPGPRKVWFELEAPLRKEFLGKLPDEYKANRINYTLVWPVMNLESFDPKLPGGGSKAMRKEKHKFYRSHMVWVEDAKTFSDKGALERMIDIWIEKRPTNDKVWHARYRNVIKNNFAGMDEARVFMVDGRPAGFNAGWKIPNSDIFYAGVGIHDYSVEDLGLVLYWEDLIWLKHRGYRTADMGGTFGPSLYFKNKFHPSSYYKTFVFSVVKK
jgi:hypothetical protein